MSETTEELNPKPPTDRQKLAALFNKQLFFQDATQYADLLDSTKTQDCLISFLLNLLSHGFHVELTAVKTDHHDDSDLGLHCHFNGYCVDCWPLSSAKPGDYQDAGTKAFRKFLQTAASNPYLYQIGLAGSADTAANQVAAGHTVFSDNGEDHIHFGSQTIILKKEVSNTQVITIKGIIKNAINYLLQVLKNIFQLNK